MMSSMNYQDCLISQKETAGLLPSSLQTLPKGSPSTLSSGIHSGKRFCRDQRVTNPFPQGQRTVFHSSKLDGGDRIGAQDLSTDTSEVSTRETSPKLMEGLDGSQGNSVFPMMNAGRPHNSIFVPKFDQRRHGPHGNHQGGRREGHAPRNNWIFASANYDKTLTCNLSLFITATTPVVPIEDDFTLKDIWDSFEESSCFGVDCKVNCDGEYQTLNYAPALSGLLIRPRKYGNKYAENFPTIKYSENEQPHLRAPVHETIEEMAEKNPNLNSLRFSDISENSWFAVLWTPVHRLRDSVSQTSVLVYYRLRRADPVGDDGCRLEIMGILFYRGDSRNWTAVYNKETMKTNQYQSDRTTTSFFRNLSQIHGSMSRIRDFYHKDYDFYSQHQSSH